MTFRSGFEHRDALLRAAIDEFSAHGYDSASINRILERSQMSKGQLYHHFTNKEGLFLGLIEWLIDEKITWLAELGPPSPPEADFFDALAQQMRLAVTFATSHQDADRLSRALLAERGRPIFAAVIERFGYDTDGPLAALVQQYHAIGAFRSDLPITLIQRLVALVVNHTPDLLALNRPDDVTKSVEQLLSFLRDGLTARGADQE
jgi:AcrR family transcriptional regulator